MSPDSAVIPTSSVLSAEAWAFAARRTWHGFVRHRGIDSAATLSYFGALSLFPISLSVVSALAVFAGGQGAVDDILETIGSVVQPDAVDSLRAPLTQLLSIPNPGIALAIGLLLTLWTVSSYLTAFGRAVNTAYEVQEGRRLWKFRGSMLLVAAVFIVAGSAIAVILLATPGIAESIGRERGLAPSVVVAWNWGKWPVLAALAFFCVGVLYFFTPNVRHLRIRWVSWGAMLAVVAWAIATAGFALYVANVARYNEVYGWLGGAVVMLLWLYLSNLVLVFGAEADAEIVRVRQLQAGITAEAVIQLPLRDSARNLTLARHLASDELAGRGLRERADQERAEAGRPDTTASG